MRNGYQVKVGLQTEQRAVFVTERKVSHPGLARDVGLPQPVCRVAASASVQRDSIEREGGYRKARAGRAVLGVSAEDG
ncbi:MAG: hypothetical protein U0361_07670 [Nitrospiraceae bacterium]